MADQVTTVNTIDIQLLNADRADVTTIKLDNPINGITREQVSAVMQPALTNGWLLTTKGDTAMYLGDITLNTSIKTKLGGEDFYVTPSTLSFALTNQKPADNKTVTVSGATIQGYNIRNLTNANLNYKITIADNGLSIQVIVLTTDLSAGDNGSFDLELVIQGTIVTIPCSYSKS